MSRPKEDLKSSGPVGRWGDIEQILLEVRQSQLRTAEVQQNIRRFMDLLAEELPQYRETVEAGDAFQNWLRPLLPPLAD